MKPILENVRRALSQASTWRGIIAVAAAIGIKVDPQLTELILTIAFGSIGTINILKKD